MTCALRLGQAENRSADRRDKQPQPVADDGNQKCAHRKEEKAGAEVHATDPSGGCAEDERRLCKVAGPRATCKGGRGHQTAKVLTGRCGSFPARQRAQRAFSPSSGGEGGSW